MIALLLPLAFAADEISISWTAGPDMPRPSAGHAASVIGENLFVVGGTNWRKGRKFWLDDILRFDFTSREWTCAGRLPASIAYAASASDGKRMYLCGGSDGEHDFRSCLELSASGSSLKCRPLAPLPEPRVHAGAAICGDTLYVVGGVTDHRDLSSVSGRLFAMKLTGSRTRWTELAPLPEPRFVAGIAAAAGQVFVFGGGRLNDNGAPENLSDCWAYHPGSDLWTRIADLPRATRGMDALAVTDDLILIFGGYTATAEEARRRGAAFGFTDSVIAFLPQTGQFQSVGRMPYAAIGTAPTFIGKRIYLTGGEDKMRSRTARLAVGALTLQ